MKNKKEILGYIGITFVIVASLLLILSIINDFNEPKTSLDNVEEDVEEKSTLNKILEAGLVILVIILVILGLIIGFYKLQHAEEENQKKYLKVDKELDDEYKLEYGERIYYLRKKDLKK